MEHKLIRFGKISKDSYEKVKNSDDTHKSYNFVDYDDIQLPKRSTKMAAGYDFYLTRDIDLEPGESTIIDTFIRCELIDRFVLQLYPRSGLGFKYEMGLANTVGIIDADYYDTISDNNTNEGHIMVKIVNGNVKKLSLKKGDRFCQGVIMQYYTTYNDSETEQATRNGGFNSTGD